MRGAIFEHFAQYKVDLGGLWDGLKRSEGFADNRDLATLIKDRYDDETQAAFLERMREEQALLNSGQRTGPRQLLLSLPDDFFCRAVELGLELSRDYCINVAFDTMSNMVADYARGIQALLERENVPYRINDEDRLEWYGDEGVHAAATAPALGVLADPRLRYARADYEEALGRLRLGTQNGLRDALNYAGSSVEAAMKAVLREHEIAIPTKGQAADLWSALRKADLGFGWASSLVLCAAVFRNEQAAHAEPEPTTVEEVEAVLAGAAGAIVYLATLLP